jgi:hydrogenase maturation protein HypF
VTGRHIEIRGVVQGVGFRPWIYRLATRAGLSGHVRNDAAGVTIEAFGPEEAIDGFVRGLEEPPRPAIIGEVRSWAIPAEALDGFAIVHSEQTRELRVSIPPDLATCRDCIAEIVDPANRRHRYPFTNCTNCGPRFTIAHEVPYDRPATTMAPFRMCADCQREYDDPEDRRFHAQPNACPVCGPTLELCRADGRVIDADPLAAVSDALLTGQVVAIKGLGGFHLACDATSAQAVQRLRERKRREEKPFAVMVMDLAHAAEIALLSETERSLLESVERPIVLALRRAASGLARDVAPNNPLIGVMLPYTPLHHVLMRDVRRPLVMTSGNLAEEPIAFRNEDALQRLSGVADLFLLHDREIETRCDDSVARVIAGRPMVLRRSRGYVPKAVAVSRRFDPPVLACGGLLKNTFCIGLGDAAYLGPHIGDLENFETYQSFEESVARLERFLRVSPAIIAHDLHPEYLSTTYARARPEPMKIAVQHHHAHAVSAMAEHGLRGPAIAVVYDGTGYGSDGTAWGGEVLVAREESFDRVATLRPIPLAGADAAIRQPWRIALALVVDAFDGQAPLDDLQLFARVPPGEVTLVRQMLASQFRSPLAHGAGRYFDGVGSLVLARPRSRYEGQVALEWNGAADPGEGGLYDYDIDWGRSPWQIDLRPMMRNVVRDLLGGVAPSTISARFHNTLATATATIVRRTAREQGTVPVVLTGGCFQNARLAEHLADHLANAFTVHLHREVPPGDGGLALGQAVVAAAVARRIMA